MKIYPLLILVFCFACTPPTSTDSNTTSTQDTETPKATPTNKTEEVKTVTDDTGTGPEVYVAHDGDKYHTADCRYSKTAHAVKLTQAKADGKTACSICKPNSKTGEQQTRCSTTTAEGKRCQRMTTDASGKCFQHRDN